ncbi:hypothetical protein ABIB40_003468 [Pedobacter sp. UYP30]|uniref:hypothetical protein n=1 Tax=Pedobacter sp. UYP30 TaxID=1756400 RepID=UPI00339286CE
MNKGEIIIYKTEDGLPSIDVKLEEDKIWLTQQQMALLFKRDYKTISKHVNNILERVNCLEIQLSQKMRQLPVTVKFI